MISRAISFRWQRTNTRFLYGGCTGDLRAVSPTFNSSAIQLQHQEALCVVSTPADVDVKDSCIAVEIPWLVWLPAIGIFEQLRIGIHSVELSRNWHPSKRQHYQVYLRKFSETDSLTWWRDFFAVASGSKLRLLLSYRLLWQISLLSRQNWNCGCRSDFFSCDRPSPWAPTFDGRRWCAGQLPSNLS